ncbi:GH15602 [Drosophila grimshawi]|uniref:GH15602 n=1 Tax=Drosophila grimshawi TaxID=7222 RepID=B4J0T1_DROGR|nr:GH15602 [Drosophila grimshawi]
MEESALDVHERSNQMWRAEYKNPLLAGSNIGCNLYRQRSGKRYKQRTSLDFENQQRGNRTNHIYFETAFLEILPEIGSDSEN